MQKTQQKPSSRPLLGKKNVALKALGILVFFTLVLFSSYYTSRFLIVKKVIVNKGDSKISLQGLELFENANILFFDEKDAEKQLFRTNSYVKDVTIKKKLPSTLLVTVTFLQPSALFEAGEGYFVLSDTTRILKKIKTKDESLPLIRYYQKLSYTGYNAGDTILHKDIAASISFLEKAEDLGLKINSIDIQGFNMIALNTASQRIIFSLDKSQKDQLYQFERVVSQFKIQGRQFKSLDLRFERVIVGN